MKLLKYVFFFIVFIILSLVIYSLMHLAGDRSVEELSPRWAKEPSQFMKVAGMNIHFRDEGPKTDKDPIVLIHGTSASLHTWDGWVEALKTQHRVIRFDLPAFGLTGPDPKNNYTIERYAEVVISVLDKLKVKKAILAGNSLGGYVSWATAVFYPKRVTKLILVDASGYFFEPESIPIAFRLSQNPITSLLLEKILPRSVVEKSVKNVYGNPDLVTAELVDRYYDLTLRKGNRGALKERFDQLQPGVIADKIKTINIPTLIIWGKKDKLIPLKFGTKFKEEIKNSQLVIFDELGHVPHEENPQSTVEAVKNFLLDN